MLLYRFFDTPHPSTKTFEGKLSFSPARGEEILTSPLAGEGLGPAPKCLCLGMRGKIINFTK